MLIKPRWNAKSRQYEWKGVEVKESTNKAAGYGLFATQDLPKDTVLPYLGHKIRRRLSEKEWETNHYLLEIQEGKLYIDGNPHDPSNRGKAIAGYINEPGPNQQINCIYLIEENGAFVVTLRKILAGEELLISYNFDADYQRPYSVPDSIINH